MRQSSINIGQLIKAILKIKVDLANALQWLHIQSEPENDDNLAALWLQRKDK